MNKRECKQMIKATMKEYMPQRRAINFEVDSQNHSVEFKKRLDLVESDHFIRFVLALVFDNSEGGIYAYHPERLKVAMFAALLRFYTDIEITDYNLSDMEKLYCCNKFRSFIVLNKNQIDSEQYHDLEAAIEQKIQIMIAKKEKNSLDLLAEKLSAYIDNMNQSFSSVSADEVSGFMKGLAQLNSVDENALVKAVKDSMNVDQAPEVVETPDSSEDEIDAYI